MKLSKEVKRRQAFGEAICKKLKEAIEQIGFNEEPAFQYPVYQSAEFQLVKDPFSGKENLLAYWYDAKRQRIGQLQFQSDDSCYAEYDVVREHPVRKKIFVEAVTAWGRQEELTAEARLLEMP